MTNQNLQKREPSGKRSGLKAIAIILTLVMIFGTTITTALADSIGPNAPTNISAGTWANPGNVAASDNVYASVTLNTSVQATPFFYAEGYNFSVPDNATITGIAVTVERKQSGAGTSFYDEGACLIVDDALYTTPNRATGTTWQTTDLVTTFGGANDLWGRTLTPALVNKSNFGFWYYARKISGLKTAMIDYIGMTVYYTLPDTTPPVIAAQSDMTVEATSASGAIVNFTPTAADNVDPAVTVVCTPASGSEFPLGTTQVTCNASDAAGNTAVPVTFNVTVQDTTAPVIALTGSDPVDISQNLTYAEQGATWSDVVDGTGAAIVGGDTVNTAAPGAYTITYNYTDAAGNAAAQITRTVNVIQTYTVTYDGNGSTGGTVPTDGNAYHANDTITVMDNTGSLEKTRYAFAGWNTAADGSGTSYAAAATFPITANITLYAQWTLLPTYTVTYDGNGSTGGTAPADGNAYLASDTVTVKGNTGSLTKTGFDFAGWNTAADGSGTNYAAGATFPMTANTTLYAKWTAESLSTLTLNCTSTTGSLLNGVSVSIYNSSDVKVGSGTSGASGIIAVPGLAAGNYHLTVTAVPSGYQKPAANIDITIDAGKDSDFDILLEKSQVESYLNWQLKSLKVSAGTLSPAFDPNKLSYKLQLSEKTSKVTLTPALADTASKLYINGKRVKSITVSLKNGASQKVTIQVRTTGGTKKNYTVTVTRSKSTNANLSNISASRGSLKPVFSRDITNYALNLKNTQTSVTITPKPSSSYASYSIKVNGKTSGRTITLSKGRTKTVTITVKAQAGNKKTYTVVITRAK
jgi:uncharacterized repeat protein (TIGR02543 family)